MKSPILTHTALCFALAGAAIAEPDKGGAARQQVEVCFVLDTTGSMGGLIAGAKEKIWSIANDLTDAEPSPDLRIALVGYRDRGDEYITKKFALTDDLDAVYENLMKFQANGGGDGPESVNQALHEAVTEIEWSGEKDTLKLIFLVGDYPPHMDYENDVKYPQTCKAAVKKDIIINTVQCGTHAATTPIWKEIARASEGSFAAIEQSGGMAAIETPVDGRIAELTRAINATVISFGTVAEQQAVEAKLAAADAAPESASAARSRYFSKKLAGKAISGGGDLVADYAEGKVELGEIEAPELPEEYRKLSEDELDKVVKEKLTERQKLQEEMNKLVAEREKHVKEVLAKRRSEKRDSGFDAEIRRTVKEQGAKKGIEYKSE